MITRTYLQVTLPRLDANQFWVEEVGHFLIDNVTVEIGGQQIDKHYGEWLSIWNSLSLTYGQEEGYKKMIGNISTLISVDSAKPPTTLYIPLIFWFNRNAGLALPLIALQYHEVKINVEFASLKKVTRASVEVTGKSLVDASLYVDYVYLARDERRRFAQSAHEYLIEQLQFHGDDSLSGTNHKIKLNFNHPVKELVWVVQQASNLAGVFNQPNNFTNDSDSPSTGLNPLVEATIQLNGHERFSVRKGDYFNVVQPFQHHSNAPPVGVNVYSFAEKPEEHQPTGTANFSRIDNANLVFSTTGAENTVVRIYATNYNVLRIMSGMGGLAFAN